MSNTIRTSGHATQAGVIEASTRVLASHRVAVLIVAYNAERHIEEVLRRIPESVARKLTEVIVIDDCSSDRTHAVARDHAWPEHFAPLRVFRTPVNQGYGGNQQLGYRYAVEREFDIVVLLHGDGQYAPEVMGHILAPYVDPDVAAVFGTRFDPPSDALKGGMPLYKWLGNRVLTFTQNRLLGLRLSELHCGYRSYRVSTLAQLPLERNGRDFGFDADIIGQLAALKARIVEIPIPTYYGDELCYVNGVKYAWQCLRSAWAYRLMKCELLRDPRFDVTPQGERLYTAKFGPHTLHRYIRDLPLLPGTRLLDVGGGDGSAASAPFAREGVQVTCIDQDVPGADAEGIVYHKIDLDSDAFFTAPERRGSFDTVFALDTIEHVGDPEKLVRSIRRVMREDATLYASTGNIAFLPMRLLHLFGAFNYGRRGILDRTHKRLFTVRSFRRLFERAYFRVRRRRGFGVPLSDLTGSERYWVRALEAVLARLADLWPSMFAYQILFECERTTSPDELAREVFGQETTSTTQNP